MKPYCLIQSVDAAWIDYLNLVYAHHAAYAERCGADYLTFTGLRDDRCHPSWNKIDLLHDALASGYDKVLWLDADCLVLDTSTNIFTETSASPVQMCRWGNWIRLGQPHCNAGVIVVTNSPEAENALHWVWDHRHDPPRPHHIPQHWEQSWLADYVDDHPECFGELDRRFNYVHTWGKVDRPVIQAWHGLPNRLEQYRAAVERLNGHPPDPDAMPEADWMPHDPWKAFLEGKPKGQDYFPALTRFIRDYGITSVVEIGVRGGYGMAAMLRGNPTLCYLGIDNGSERPDGLAHAERLRDQYSQGKVTLMQADSRLLHDLPGRFDLAYVDGEHTDEACSSDLALCAGACTYLLCDDYDWSLGVRHAVQRFCRSRRIPLTYLPTVHGWALLDMRQAGTAPRNQRFSGETMTYLCTATQPQYHRMLATLEPGRTYEFSGAQEAAAEACVKSGVLRRLDDILLPDDDDEALHESDAVDAEDA